MIRLRCQIICLMFLAAVPATLSVVFHPKKPAWTQIKSDEIGLEAANQWKAEALWVDARTREDYDKDHIPGAVCLNEDHWNEMIPGLLDRWAPSKKIVVYCSSQSCSRSHAVAKRLREEVGLTDVFVLEGGWEAWLKAKH